MQVVSQRAGSRGNVVGLRFIHLQGAHSQRLARWLRSRDELAALRQSRAQAGQVQQLIEAAPLAARSIKDLAEARARTEEA